MSPARARGEQRRDELVAAGVALLAEEGWAGLTHRAVAARANANPGLVHYYFNGSDGLRVAVAREAASDSIGAVFNQVLEARDDVELVRAIADAVSGARQDAAAGRVTAELVSAAFSAPQIAEVIRAEFARGRERVQEWLGVRHPELTTDLVRGTAALMVAAVDGLVLHLVLDPDLQVGGIAEAVLRMSRSTAESSDQQDRQTI